MTPIQVAEALTGWAQARAGGTAGAGPRRQKGDLSQLAAMVQASGGRVVREPTG